MMAALRRILIRHHNCRGFATALYVPGHKAQAAAAILTPSLDHIDQLLDDRPLLDENHKARGYEFNLDVFEKSWKELKNFKLIRDSLEVERTKISEKMKILSGIRNKTTEQLGHMEELKREGKLLREKLKELNQELNNLEETVMNEALALPNVIHSETPTSCRIVCSSKEQQTFSFPPKSHIDIAVKHDWAKLTTHSPTAYYLKDRLAVWELRVSQSFANALKKAGFSYMSAPDFAKSIVVDGCGYEFSDPKKVYVMKAAHDNGIINTGSALHLVGGASLPSFAAFFAKNVVESPLPVRYCGIGRHYAPPAANFGLFNAAQATAVQFLSCVENDPDFLWQELEHIQQCLTGLLNHYNLPFQIVANSPKKLQKWEQYRSSLQVLSPFLNDYVEVGHISIAGDYISRRLAVYGSSSKHPGFVTGTALNAVRFLACFLENRQREDGSIGSTTVFDS